MQEMPRSTSDTFRYYYTLHLYQSALIRKLAIIFAFVFTVFVIWQRLAFALPSGYNAEHGEVNFEKANEKTLNISASHNSIINYHSFDIAADETVNFTLPSVDSFSLNRVTGGAKTSIFGNLYANGNLILVNGSGFHFGQTAQINVGGLMASTHNISNANFLAGRYVFAGLGSGVDISKSYILNEGHIKTREGGMAVFVADAIENHGVIEAPLGMVALAAGNMVTVGISYDGLISVGIDEPTSHMITDHNGVALADQVKNTGLLSASGGKVLVNAQAVHNIFASGINMGGHVQANKVVVGKDGSIEIVSSGDMALQGVYEAEGGKVDFESGKTIRVTGDTVTKGDTTFKSKEDIVVNADVTTDSGTLIFHADSDLDGVGAFLQKTDTTIKTTTFGDIKIYSSGESTLANIRSAGKVYLEKAGAPVKYVQHPDSKVSAGSSLHIGSGVELKASNTVYEVATDWVNQGAFAPDTSSVKLVGPSDSVVYGDNTFNNFEVIEPGKNVSFEAGKTQEVLGVLTLRGENGKLLVVRSTQPSIPWIIKPTGPTDVAYVDLQDSTNVNIHGPPVEAVHSLNSLGNTGWVFSDVVFLGSHSALWSDPANWDGGFLPGAGSVVKFASLSPDSHIDGDYTIGGLILDATYTGTLYAGSHTLTVSGNWSNHGGHFDAGTSTVVFNDASKASYISGSTTFYNFTSLTPGKHFYFATEGVTTILGTWKLQGLDYEENHIHLYSQVAGSHWYVDPKGPRDMWGVIMKDSVNLDPEIIVYVGSNRGNAVNWDPIIYWDGGAGGTWTTASNWGPSNVVPGAGDDVWFGGQTGATIQSSVVNADFTILSLTIFNDGTTTSAPDYSGTIILGQSATPVRTLVILGTFTMQGGTISGAIAGQNIAVGGSFIMQQNGNNATGPNISSANVSITMGFDTTPVNLTKTFGTLGSPFWISKTGGVVNLTAALNSAMTGTFTLSSGTLALGAFNLDLNGATTWAGTVTSSGGRVLSSTTFTQNSGSIAAITFDGTGTITQNGGTLADVIFSPTSTYTIGSNFTITGNFVKNNNTTLTAATALKTVSVDGNFTWNLGTASSTFLKFALTNSSPANLTVTGTTLDSLVEINKPGTTATLTQTGAFGLFTMTAGTLSLGSFNLDVDNTFTMDGGSITGSGSLLTSSTFTQNAGTISAPVTFDGTGTITQNGGTLANVTFSPTSTYTIGSNFTITGNFVKNNNTTLTADSTLKTVSVEGNFTWNLGTASSTFLKFALTNSSPANLTVTGTTLDSLVEINKPGTTATLTQTGAFGLFTMTAGTLSLGSFNLDVDNTFTMDGGAITAGSGSVLASSNFTQNAGSITAIAFDGSSGATLVQNGGTITNMTVSHSFGNKSINSDFIVTGNLVFSGTGDFDQFDANPRTVTVQGNLTQSAGTIGTFSDLTFRFTGSGAQTIQQSGTFTFRATVTVDKTAGQLTLLSGLTMGNSGFTTALNLANSTSVLSLNGFGLTMTNMTFSNNGTVRLAGNESISGLTQDIDSGTWEFVGTVDSVQNTRTLLDFGATDYFNLAINADDGALDDIFQLGAALKLAGDLTLSSGTLDASASNFQINVAGNWSKTSGVFTPRSGTVVLDGTSQTLSGATTFFNLTKQVASSVTLTFGTGASNRTTVTGTLTLEGTSGNLLLLRSSSSPTQWEINPQGTRSISFVDVQDSNNINATAISPTNSVNSGNNTNWTFALTITGRVYTDAGVTGMGSGRNVALSINGAAASSTGATDGSGNYSVSFTSLAANDVLTLYLDNAAEDAVTVTIAAGNTSLSGVDLYQNYLITRHENAGPVTNTTLDTADNNADADISAIYSVSGGALTLVSGKSLFVWSGKTHTPGGAVTSGLGVDIRGTMNMGVNTLTLPGNFGITGGTFTTSGTVVFNGSGTQTFNPGSGSFVNITHSGSGTLQLVTNNLTVTGALTNSAGTFDLNGRNLSVTGAVSNTSTIRRIGSETVTLSSGNDVDSGTWLYVGDGDFGLDTYTLTDFGATDYFNLTIQISDFTDVVQSVSSAKVIAGAFTVTSGTYNANGNTTTVTGLTTVNGGTYSASTNTQTFNGGLTITSGSYSGGSGTTDINGNMTFSGGSWTATSGNTFLSGNWTYTSGTFSHNFGTFTIDGSSTALIALPGEFSEVTFYNFRVNTSNGVIKYLDFRDIIRTDGYLELVEGQLEKQKSGAVFGSARIRIMANAKIYSTWDGGNLELRFAGSANQTFEALAQLTRHSIIINKTGGVVTLLAPLNIGGSIASRLEIRSGILDLNFFSLNIGVVKQFINNGTIRVRGTPSVSFTDGTVNDTDSGTWEYYGDGDFVADTFTILEFGLIDYFNLIINTTDGMDIFYFANNTNVAGTMTVTNTGGLTFQAGTTLTVSGSLTLQGISSANRMELRSSSPGTQWFLNAPASYSLSFLDVQDSNALGSVSDPLFCSTCTNSGNNTSWTI